MALTLLAQLLEQRARADPDGPALRFAGRSLNNAALLAEVRRRACSVTGQVATAAGTVLGVNVARDLDSVLAVLAVLESGCVYLPLDASWPAGRRDWVLDDVGAAALITPDEEDIEVSALPGVGQRPPLDPATAYVLYTSGSTGRPKGVAVSHANVLSMLEGATSCLELGARDVWSIYHSLSFDFSVWELWGALYSGGSAVVLDRRTVNDPQAVLDVLTAEQVSVLSIVPSIFSRLTSAYETGRGQRADRLRYVVFGGEAIDRRQCKRWLRLRKAAGVPTGRLVNMYGITEATVHTTTKLLDADDLAGTAADTPIGRPLPSLRVTLLDGVQPVPAGDVGELVVSGAGVALGYVRNPTETATRFVELEFADGIRRCLRTGDLARYDEAGELHFVGRADSQVKINGFRIELGEIEAALDGLARVTGGVASKVAGPDGLARLGLLVSAAVDLTPAEVRAHLRTRLPLYMVPGLVRIVDALPLGTNGKIDRPACAALTASQPAPEANATIRSSPGE